MASPDHQHPKSLCPQVDHSNSTPAPSAPPSSSLYPSVDMRDLVENLFPNTDEEEDHNHKASGDKSSPLKEPPVEETLMRIPGAVLHLIDKHQSVEIGCGDFVIARLRQGENVVAVLARVADAVQWPLAKDEAAVRLDDSHYFFSLHVPEGAGADGGGGGGHVSEEDVLSYGLTFASKGQERLLKELDGVLEHYSSFSVQKVVVEKDAGGEVLGGRVARETTPEEVMMEGSKKKEVLEKEASAYWTTLAPNVEDYSGSIARLIAKGSGQLIRGILWCGDVTVDRLTWGNDVLKKRIAQKQKSSEISPAALRRIQRVKTVTKMSENVVNGILSGVVKVSGFFTSSIVNSKAGKKVFGLLPGEIVLATLDGFGKICDAVEVAGRNVLSTSSTVTTGLVSHRYGEQAANATSRSMDAAGHAMGTAWAVFKIRKALNPKSVMKPTTLAKSAAKAAAAEIKGKKK